MTVIELVIRLQNIKDQDKPVHISGNSALKEFVWHEHVHDHPHAIVIG